jgi:hypothetical protein
VPFPTGGDHGHLMGVFKPPANLSAEEFVNKTQGLVSRFFALPIAQKLVNYSLVRLMSVLRVMRWKYSHDSN